jgi:glycosyltransferase involved in cell wall biosynthesis
LISIVVNNFNYARYLAQSVDSALGQTYPHIEVLVVDDVSTDDSRQIIARYGDRVIPILPAVNGGQGAAFNAAFRASRGDIVMFLDSDDWLYPQAAQRVAENWVPGQSKMHFRLDLVDINGAWIDVHPPLEVPLDGGDVLPLLFEFGRYETVVTTGNAFARAALEMTMPIPEERFKYGADGYLATVVPFHGPVVTVEERLGTYRVHGDNAYATGSKMETAASFSVRARRRLDHDEQKGIALRAKAAALGYRLDGSPHLKDPIHLELRMASLLIDPAGHPYRDDGRRSLALRGFAASRRARLPWARRMVMATWFLLAGLLPRSLAYRAICWRMMPSHRPRAIDRSLKWIRRVLQ